MGLFSAIGRGVRGIGKIARKAAPFVGLIPGVGTLAAAGLGAAGGLLGGEGFRGALRGAAGGALGGLAGRIPGVGNLISGAGSAIGGAFSGENPLARFDRSGQGGGGGGGGDDGGGGFGGAIRGIGGFLGRNAPTILGGVSALSNARDDTRTRGFEDEQADFARQSMERRRAMEQQIMSGLGQAPPSFDFSSTFADPSNPFSQQQGVPGVGGITMPQNVPIPPPQQPQFDPRLMGGA